MREELAPFKVRLTFIAPGMTETPIFSLMSIFFYKNKFKIIIKGEEA